MGKPKVLLWFSAVKNLKSFVHPALTEFFFTEARNYFSFNFTRKVVRLRMRGLLLASLVVLSVRQDVVETPDFSYV